jgi:hypothetical protein
MRGVLMARRGRKRRLELEAAYWELLQNGIGTIAACEAVGIGRKTGYRWRAENGGLPPALIAEANEHLAALVWVTAPRLLQVVGPG